VAGGVLVKKGVVEEEAAGGDRRRMRDEGDLAETAGAAVGVEHLVEDLKAGLRLRFDNGAFLEANGIYPRGRYGAWTYNAMEDCVLAGREVAAVIDGKAAA